MFDVSGLRDKSPSQDAWEDYLYWQTQDKKTLKRINQLIQDIQRNGCMNGIGKPERPTLEQKVSKLALSFSSTLAVKVASAIVIAPFIFRL